MTMVWKILRPHYWMLDRKVRQTNRIVVIALLLILGFIVQWVWNNLVSDKLALLPPEQTAMFIAGFMPLTLYLMLSFLLLGVGDVMRQLYLASDLDLLMIAPIPQRTIFVVKLLQCSRATFIPALVLGVIFFALGFAQTAALSYFLLVVVLLVMGMIFTTTVVMLLVMLLARVLPARHIRSWMPVAISLVVFALMFGQQWMTQWFFTQTGLIKFLTEASLNPGQLALVALGVGGVATLTSLVAYRIFDTSFRGGWDHLREVPAQRKPSPIGSSRRRGVSRLVRPLSEPLRSFLVKEWLELRRDPQGLMNVALPPILILVLVLVPIMGSGSGREALQPLFFWFLLMVISLFLGILPVGATLMSIAREGHNMALLRSAPISMADMLKGKYWSTWTPMALSWLLILIGAGIWMKLPVWQIGFLVGVSIWALAGASLATLAIGGLKVNFETEDLKHRMPVFANYLTMALNGVFGLLTISVGIWLITRLLPDSSIALVVRMLSGFSAVGWLLSDKLWIPMALLGSQAAFWVGTKVLWDAAVRRLEAWEGI
jgi:hypothetical protein